MHQAFPRDARTCKTADGLAICAYGTPSLPGGLTELLSDTVPLGPDPANWNPHLITSAK